MPPTGDLGRNPGMCPDQNQTCNPLVCRLSLNPLSHTSQSEKKVFEMVNIIRTVQLRKALVDR